MPQPKPLSLAPEKTAAKPSAQRKRPWGAVILALILAGAAAWFWIGKDPTRRDAVLSTAREVVSDVTKKVMPNVVPDAATATTGATQDQPAGQIQGQTQGQVQGQTQDQAQSQASGQTAGQLGQAPAGAEGAIADGSQPRTDATPGTQGATNLPVLTAPDATDAEGKTTRGLIANDPTQPLDPGLAGRKDDAVVRVAFIDDLARWMVDNYVPANSKGGRGGIGIGVQSANARYGVGMKGLAWIGDDLPAGRAEALKYVYTPSMLDALYRMYIDRFMQAMAEISAEPRKNGKILDPAQLAEMYRLYAGRLRALSGAMQGVAALDDLRARVGRIQEASSKVVAANGRYMEEVFKFDQAREGNNQALIDKTRTAMEAASDAYQQASRERDQLREALIGAIRNNPGARTFGDDNLMFVALWIDRRLQQSPQALDASLQAATLFLDLAQRFEQVAGIRP